MDWSCFNLVVPTPRRCASSITIFNLVPLFLLSLFLEAFLPLPTISLSSFSKNRASLRISDAVFCRWRLCSMSAIISLSGSTIRTSHSSHPSSTIAAILLCPEMIRLSLVIAIGSICPNDEMLFFNSDKSVGW